MTRSRTPRIVCNFRRSRASIKFNLALLAVLYYRQIDTFGGRAPVPMYYICGAKQGDVTPPCSTLERAMANLGNFGIDVGWINRLINVQDADWRNISTSTNRATIDDTLNQHFSVDFCAGMRRCSKTSRVMLFW